MKATTPLLLVLFASSSQAVLHVNFDNQVNAQLSTLSGGSGYPVNGGFVTISGIEHRIAVNSQNRSAGMFASNETKVIPVNAFGISEVYTIINSGYGAFGQLNGRVEVHGTGGLLETMVLTQGTNIRDHYNGNYNNVANSLNGSLGYTSGVRFDQQKIVLNPAFQNAFVTEIRFIGQNNFGLNGSPMVQSISLIPVNQAITGTLAFNDTVGTFAVSRTIGYSILQGTTTVQTGSISSSTSSVPYVISLPANVTGPAVLSFDGSSFLKKNLNITLAGATVANGTTNLVNGDSDLSGEVDAADIDLVIADFGSTSSGNSDVDVSGEVDAADIDIVIANFGATDD